MASLRLRQVCMQKACGLSTTLFWVITQGVMVIPYRRFGTTYRSRLHGSRIHKESREP